MLFFVFGHSPSTRWRARSTARVLTVSRAPAVQLAMRQRPTRHQYSQLW